MYLKNGMGFRIIILGRLSFQESAMNETHKVIDHTLFCFAKFTPQMPFLKITFQIKWLILLSSDLNGGRVLFIIKMIIIDYKNDNFSSLNLFD